MGKFKDLSGQKFGKLTVKYRYGINKHKQVLWYCECDCGGSIIVAGYCLVNGNTKSCGCLLKECCGIIGKSLKKYNTYDLTGEYGIGYTFKNEEFYFDLEDYNKIKDYCWRKDKYGYIVTMSNGYLIRLHRLVTEVLDKKEVCIDHISHDKSDNRKINLRVADYSINNINKDKCSGNNIVKGVYWEKHAKKWRARIEIQKQTISLGLFSNIEDAIKARKEAEEKYFGEYSFENSTEYAKLYKI